MNRINKALAFSTVLSVTCEPVCVSYKSVTCSVTCTIEEYLQAKGVGSSGKMLFQREAERASVRRHVNKERDLKEAWAAPWECSRPREDSELCPLDILFV